MLGQKLPKLPVPDLGQTLRKYLISVRPLLTPTEYSETVRVTNDFLKNEGPHLQSRLLSRAAVRDNWLSEWWLHVAYLSYRMPVQVYSTPAALCDKTEFETHSALLDYMSYLIIGIVEFLLEVEKGELPVDTFRGTPLCMQQYKSLVGHRIPGKEHDSQSFHLDSDYIILVHKGHFYKFPVFRYHNGTRSLLHSHEIKYLISKILEKSESPTVPVGSLTTLDRDSWYTAREEMKTSEINLNSLEALQKCLVSISLDEGGNVSNDASLRRTILGDLRNNFGNFNRWNDVGLQLIVSKDGYVSFLLEHSIADGPPAIHLGSRGHYSGLTRRAPDIPVDLAALPKVELLQWDFSPLLLEYIEDAKWKLKKLSDKLDLKTCRFTNFGKKMAKSYKISPDSLIQLGIQLTFYKLHGHPTACYESVSTRKFHDGRTETLRSTSPESIELIKSLLSECSTEDRIRLLKTFVKTHDENSRQAWIGQGIDRHLLGLRLLASEDKMSPEFFSDPAYVRSTSFRLSTSQIPNPLISFIGFGPVVEDGYGIGYNPQDSHIIFTLSSYTTSPNTVSAEKLSQVLFESLLDIRRLVENLPITAKL